MYYSHLVFHHLNPFIYENVHWITHIISRILAENLELGEKSFCVNFYTTLNLYKRTF